MSRFIRRENDCRAVGRKSNRRSKEASASHIGFKFEVSSLRFQVKDTNLKLETCNLKLNYHRHPLTVRRDFKRLCDSEFLKTWANKFGLRIKNA